MAKQQVTRKRTQLRKKKSDGIDPRILALGAGAGLGALAGRKASGALARRGVATEVAKTARADKSSYYKQTGNLIDTTVSAARKVATNEYNKMPLANADKLTTYRRLVGQEKVGSSEAQKISGLSKGDMRKYEARLSMKGEMAGAKARGGANDAWGDKGATTAESMKQAAKMRAVNKRGSYTRRGAVGGAATAATIATIVSAVMKELNKK